MFRRISARLAASILAFLVLILATSVATYYFVDIQRYDSLLVNLSARQEMLEQKLVKEVLAYSAGVEDATAAAKQIHDTAQAFETTLKALKDGGAAPINLAMTEMKESPGTDNPKIKTQLSEVEAIWGPFLEAVEKVVSSRDPEAVRFIADQDAVLLSALTETTNLLREDAEAKFGGLFWVQAGTTVLGVLLVIVILWATWRNIGLPLRTLVNAAQKMSTGDLDTPISREGPAEIEELAESFERLRVSIKAVLEEAEAAVMGGGVDELDQLDALAANDPLEGLGDDDEIDGLDDELDELDNL